MKYKVTYDMLNW